MLYLLEDRGGAYVTVWPWMLWVLLESRGGDGQGGGGGK